LARIARKVRMRGEERVRVVLDDIVKLFDQSGGFSVW
jgi:hypothetical protein